MSFLITTIAGFSTLLGLIPCFFHDIKKDKVITYSLTFSAIIMIIISTTSLIPESFIIFYKTKTIAFCYIITIICIIIGFIFSFYIDKKVDTLIKNNILLKIGLISTIALILHNIPEGITTYISYNTNKTLGIKLALAIALHNIPEGIAIAIPIYYSTKNINKAFIYTFISGFSELLGAIIAKLFIVRYINDYNLALILSITAGIMLEIAIFEILPTVLKKDYFNSLP